jgi:putative polyhydroxyalkanoate system protein
MSNIRVTRQHKLGLQAARGEVERIAQRVQDELGAEYAWLGDTMTFARSGVSGQITITHDSLDLRIKLGWMLAAMKGQIEHKLVGKIDERLARHHGQDNI